MSAKSLGVSLLLVAAWSFAHAGPVYKIVGPDGKITFSDTPPAEAPRGTYQVVGSPGSAVPPPPREPTRAAASDIQFEPSPELEGAVIGVLGIEDIVKRTEDVCVETLPTSSSVYGAAVAAWQARNGAVVARAREVLASEFDAATGAALSADLRAKNDGVFTPVRAASAAARLSWCHESFATMNGGTMDVHDNPKLTMPLAER